jgi:DNA-binding NarL/FixJ family response regulator
MRILLADDHDLIRDTIEEFLKRLDKDLPSSRGQPVGPSITSARPTPHVSSCRSAHARMNGLAGLKSVQAARAGVPIVILSGETNPDTIRNALQGRAAAFLPKTMRGTAMLMPSAFILAGRAPIPDIMVAGQTAPAEESTGGGPGLGSLTQREREVIGLLVQGLPNKEIGHRLGIEVVTVALHLRSIYRKLGVASRTQAVRMAMEQGWNL